MFFGEFLVKKKSIIKMNWLRKPGNKILCRYTVIIGRDGVDLSFKK